MDDIFDFVGEFFKAMIALAIIMGLITVGFWIGSLLFGYTPDDLEGDRAVTEEFEARCRSISGEWSGTNCYKDGGIVFSK